MEQSPKLGSTELLTQVSEKLDTLNGKLGSSTVTTAEQAPTWKSTFIKYTQRFAFALAAIAAVAVLVGAGYAYFTIGLMNPVTLIVASAAGVALLVALIALGLWKLQQPSTEQAQKEEKPPVVVVIDNNN